jgi:hypothetical protein
MNRRALDSLTIAIAFSAAIAMSASYAFGGLRIGTGALAGGLVALGNWAFVRWLLTRFAAGNALSQAGLMTLLAAKFGVLGVVVWVVVGLLGLHAGGFGIGLGALVVGILFGAVNHADALVGTDPAVVVPAHESIDSAQKEH